MIAHGFVDRATKDVDLFTEIDDQEAVRVVVALRSALEDQHLDHARHRATSASPQTRCSLYGTAHDHATTSTSTFCSNAMVRIDCSNSRR
ncbi:MAG: hypothetical protein ACRDTC_28390 [Pseudonocardiaceae bacterium]